MCNLTAQRLPFKISCKGAELGSSIFWYKQQGTLCGEFNTIIQTKNHFIFFGSPLPVIPNNVSDKILPLPHTHTNLLLFRVLDNFWQVRWCFTGTYVLQHDTFPYLSVNNCILSESLSRELPVVLKFLLRGFSCMRFQSRVSSI